MAERAALCICEQTLRKKEAASVGINQSLVEYVDENVFDPELSLNMLSDIFGVSNASISRLFKNATGDTFYNYITDRRMRRAQDVYKRQRVLVAQTVDLTKLNSADIGNAMRQMISAIQMQYSMIIFTTLPIICLLYTSRCV